MKFPLLFILYSTSEAFRCQSSRSNVQLKESARIIADHVKLLASRKLFSNHNVDHDAPAPNTLHNWTNSLLLN